MATKTISNSLVKSLKTEDTGKIFEMAICLAFQIPYDGLYKYSMDDAELIKPRLARLTEIFPVPTHTAKKGARYDFTAVNKDQVPNQLLRHLSAKTTKKNGGKVAPQVVGQAKPQKFCEELSIPFTTVDALKEYIQTNITTILPGLVGHTFDCANIYYNDQTKAIKFITLNAPIDWTAYRYKWTCDHKTWANSSTLKMEKPDGTYIALLEVQFHTKSRTNMAVRWCYDNFLELFNANLEILEL